MADLGDSAKLLFAEALDLSPERRSAFLDDACSGTPELRQEVDRLLRSFQPQNQFQTDVDSTQTLPAKHGLSAGTQLGRYTIIEPLGSGGMGVVYRARDEKLERQVAVKILGSGVFADEDVRRRFNKEALALAKLNHAHIASVYDVGQQDGVDYLVMECVPGQSLAARIKAGELPIKEATAILLQIAQALEEAHEQGIIHRDLKPANVMLTPKGQVKVLDFGLAKLLKPETADAAVTAMETRGLVGTPLYMSPEQVQGHELDVRTDLWNLGVIYYELLTGRVPFQANSSFQVLRAIAEETPQPPGELRPDMPEAAAQIIDRALEKDPSRRYQTAEAVVRDATDLLARMTNSSLIYERVERKRTTTLFVTIAVSFLLLCVAAGWWFYRSSRIHWAKEEAVPQIHNLLAARRPVAAFAVLAKALAILPGDAELNKIATDHSRVLALTSSPPGASVAIQDYLTPGDVWHTLGTTPMPSAQVPVGYFRWKVAKEGTGEMVVAPQNRSGSEIDFALESQRNAPPGMVRAPGGHWGTYIGFLGWVGPFDLPPYYLDRYEVTNREYQKFVDQGGYENQSWWPATFTHDGHELTWSQQMDLFRDTTGRHGPSTWSAGHYPDGQADFPVAGVSWFEASAYAAFAGKQLPLLAQWYQAAPPDLEQYIVPFSNISGKGLAAVGRGHGLGPFGTFDMVGNVREWVANVAGENLRFILGGSWRSQPYLAAVPEALSPFDRSDTNGIRCVRNLQPAPGNAAAPVKLQERDFSALKPLSDDVFHAYSLFYGYANSPLNAKVEGVVADTADWREEKVTIDAAYGRERMAVYLFLPKHVRPPYQTVLFFPSARVLGLNDSRDLGDEKFFDYIIQSGRAVMYPVYKGTYERSANGDLRQDILSSDLQIDHYKDAARAMDYLASRRDLDSTRVGYVGVSMGSAKGVIISTLLQDRLKTAIFLDGGYFLSPASPGTDQADFAPRLKIPVLMVNGRYDFSFPLERSQNPLFAMLGTPAQDKQHVVLDTPHDVTQERPILVKTVLSWLDRYLGQVE